MKRILILLVVAMFTVGVLPLALAEPSPGEFKNIKISVNDEKVILINEEDEQLKSFVSEGIIYVPLKSFVSAIGGEYNYDESANQISIQFPENGAESDTISDEGDYSEEAISSLLLSGRWIMQLEGATATLDFKEDHTGLLTSMIRFTWAVEGNNVIVDYTAEDVDVHMVLEFKVEGGKVRLDMGAGDFFKLSESEDDVLGILGEWHAVGDASVQLTFFADATFELKVSGKTYKGTWAYGDSGPILVQNGISIFGSYNGTSIGLEINGKTFTFTR